MREFRDMFKFNHWDKDLTYDVEIYGQVEHDSAYGADADGNRGIESVSAYVNKMTVYCEGLDISDQISEKLEQIIMEHAIEHADENAWEYWER